MLESDEPLPPEPPRSTSSPSASSSASPPCSPSLRRPPPTRKRPRTAADGGRTALTFTFEHGCDSAPTTAFRIQIPDGATDIRPQATPPWAATVEPDQVRWTGGSIDGEGSFSIEMVLSQPAGTTVAVPAIQECPGGLEEAWIQLPDGGAEPAMPAPTFIVPVNATTPPPRPPPRPTLAPAEAAPTTTARMAIEDTPITVEGSETNTAGLVVFILVVGAIAGGALVLYLRHRGGSAGPPTRRSAAPARPLGRADQSPFGLNAPSNTAAPHATAGQLGQERERLDQLRQPRRTRPPDAPGHHGLHRHRGDGARRDRRAIHRAEHHHVARVAPQAPHLDPHRARPALGMGAATASGAGR